MRYLFQNYDVAKTNLTFSLISKLKSWYYEFEKLLKSSYYYFKMQLKNQN